MALDTSTDNRNQDNPIQVTFIQDDTGSVRRVRIGDGDDFPVVSAGPVSFPGATGVSINIRGVDIKYERL